MNTELHKNQVSRLNRIEGQVRGVKKMIEEDRYCMDILTQIKAVKSALKSIETSIMEAHIDHCINKGINSPNKKTKDHVISEIHSLLRGR